MIRKGRGDPLIISHRFSLWLLAPMMEFPERLIYASLGQLMNRFEHDPHLHPPDINHDEFGRSETFVVIIISLPT